jgi:hypothetical protein
MIGQRNTGWLGSIRGCHDSCKSLTDSEIYTRSQAHNVSRMETSIDSKHRIERQSSEDQTAGSADGTQRECSTILCIVVR